VHHLAGPAGIRQFLDIGTGLPTANTPTKSPSGSRPTPLDQFGGVGRKP
jgi:hypothetical protein